MQGLSLWTRCRPRLIPSEWVGHRFRSKQVRIRNPHPPIPAPISSHPPRSGGARHPSHSGAADKSTSEGGLKGTNVSPSAVLLYFRANVGSWTLRKAVRDRLAAFGAPAADAVKLLVAFGRDAASGIFDSPDAIEQYGLLKLRDTNEIEVDIAFSHIFFLWLAARQPVRGVDPATTAQLLRISETATRMHPPEEATAARVMRRKVIMHVGPTNSGKTHHALRALASAKVGVYAGPLRLLAHEIWERMNLGLIAPLGAAEEQIAAAAAIPPGIDHPFARPCNMVTGEEQKIVAGSASIHSCTVEMVFLPAQYDVAVVDEIQMISDVERGWSWTNAVLGLCTRELHLCGEETAVPVIEKLLKETGDELIVKRYDRLTPLEVEETSLEEDLSRVRPGDCIVAFSRSAIFALKREVEAQTKMRCAVVYGRLPPEIRSEQAALFNDPNSGYDVLIGSDAIGMGLNLKIRRIIFEAVSKFEGASGHRPLSVSQMKQIAGRAGRFGMQGTDEKPGGFVTTLKAQDLPFLRETLTKPVAPLAHARLAPDRTRFRDLAALLPPNAGTETILLSSVHAGNIPMCYRHAFVNHLTQICEHIDETGQFTLADRYLLTQAPFPWRNPLALGAVTEYLAAYHESMRVDVLETVRKLSLLEMLEDAEQAMGSPDGRTADGRLFNAAKQLQNLEIFHKILVVYIWLGFRNPVSYAAHKDAMDLKGRLERVLHWCLEEVTRHHGPRTASVKPDRLRIDFKSKREYRMEDQTEKFKLHQGETPNNPFAHP
ncbi:P-loop containing nucleoside triphosphate hydrolase protein [Mycena galericulata]|nr:P-loop containing nucleoside triphosphate hydrolase protein [Mycena galericulata]